MEQCFIDSPLARVAIVVWKNPMNQTFTKSTVRAICQLYILKFFRPRSNGENNLSCWVEGSPSLSSQLRQTFIWDKKVTLCPFNGEKCRQSRSSCVYSRRKKKKMRLMSFRPPIPDFFFSRLDFLLFFLFSPVPDCGIRFLQCLRFGLTDATLDLSDFKSDRTYPGCQRLFMRGFRFRLSLKKWHARKAKSFFSRSAEDESACGRRSSSSHVRKNLRYPG